MGKVKFLAAFFILLLMINFFFDTKASSAVFVITFTVGVLIPRYGK